MPKTFSSSLKQFLLSLVIGGVLGVLFTGYIVQGQFTEPTKNPPGGIDPYPALTATSTAQTKDGPLILNFTSPGGDTGLRVYGYLHMGTMADGVDGPPPVADCDTTFPPAATKEEEERGAHAP